MSNAGEIAQVRSAATVNQAFADGDCQAAKSAMKG
jgi:hypothetical protein